jgi:hypothetical protein
MGVVGVRLAVQLRKRCNHRSRGRSRRHTRSPAPVSKRVAELATPIQRPLFTQVAPAPEPEPAERRSYSPRPGSAGGDDGDEVDRIAAQEALRLLNAGRALAASGGRRWLARARARILAHKKSGQSCYYCGQVGHWKSECPELLYLAQNDENAEAAVAGPDDICFLCKQPGHFKVNCPTLAKGKKAERKVGSIVLMKARVKALIHSAVSKAVNMTELRLGDEVMALREHTQYGRARAWKEAGIVQAFWSGHLASASDLGRVAKEPQVLVRFHNFGATGAAADDDDDDTGGERADVDVGAIQGPYRQPSPAEWVVVSKVQFLRRAPSDEEAKRRVLATGVWSRERVELESPDPQGPLL